MIKCVLRGCLAGHNQRRLKWNLGIVLRVYGFRVRGSYPRDYLVDCLVEIVRACGLNPVGEPLAWGYPLNGKGGVGETIFLPFAEGQARLGFIQKVLLRLMVRHFRWAFLLFQPFTESFAVIDTYPERLGRSGPDPAIIILLGSCVPIDTAALRGVIGRRFGEFRQRIMDL